jgi:hypothetical protein
MTLDLMMHSDHSPAGALAEVAGVSGVGEVHGRVHPLVEVWE